MKRIVVIGNGKMAIDCLKIMVGNPGVDLPLVITEPKNCSVVDSASSYCEQEGIPHLETTKPGSAEVFDELRRIDPHLIFNINSYKMIREPILSLPEEGVINFHNGPLPKYGGVNVCSWAIINGEKEHGVTWHYMDQGIDTGDIIAQTLFPIDANETAISLIIKCLYQGVDLFGEIFPKIVEGDVQRIKQDLSNATYFSLRDFPNDGEVDFNWSFEKMDRFVRGLTFYPMVNNFMHPGSAYEGRKFFIERVQRIDSRFDDVDCGKVIGVKENKLIVPIRDAIVGITEVLDDKKKELGIPDFVERYKIREGEYLGTR